MNNINTEHPNWKNHLVDLIQEKWDKRDRKSLQQRWIISAKALKKIEKEEYPMIVRELITPYLE